MPGGGLSLPFASPLGTGGRLVFALALALALALLIAVLTLPAVGARGLSDSERGQQRQTGCAESAEYVSPIPAAGEGFQGLLEAIFFRVSV
jgi:hypothetical protein